MFNFCSDDSNKFFDMLSIGTVIPLLSIINKSTNNSSQIKFYDHFMEEIKIRLDNGQNKRMHREFNYI